LSMLIVYQSTLSSLESRKSQTRNAAFNTAMYEYLSNNGTAIGVGEPEALLHAINEKIERDAKSLFVTRLVLHREASPLDRASLEPEHHTYLEALNDMQAKVLLFDATSNLGVPTYCALAQCDGQYFDGWGTSWSAAHALTRALTECLQAIHASWHFRADFFDEEQQHRRRVAPFQLYRRLLSYREVAFQHRGSVHPVPLRSSPNGTVHDVLMAVQDRLLTHGFPVFAHSCTLGFGITQVMVSVPGLDNFQLVTSGRLVRPGVRTASLFAQGESHVAQ
ncbi:YcaO-like family protein, partial [Deinococcus seoulensis]|uniref:YcaO-like family protein n=1 Tax=Deinococcus seoulensis TaxID=1837379 RepID=UPI001E50A34A